MYLPSRSVAAPLRRLLASVLAAGALVASLGAANAAQAALAVEGGVGIPGNSWTAPIGYTGCIGCDMLEFFIVLDSGAGPFQNDGAFNFQKQTNWVATLINPNYSLASGDPIVDVANPDLLLTFDFDGDINQDVTVDLLGFTGGGFGVGQFIGGLRLPFEGGFLQVADVEAINSPLGYDRTLVPVPAALPVFVAALLGLCLQGGERRRRSGLI